MSNVEGTGGCYLIALKNSALGETATAIVELPEDYSFIADSCAPVFSERRTRFSKLKEICRQQVTDGFDPARAFFNKSNIDYTEVLAISRLPY